MVFGQTAWQARPNSILDDCGRVGALVQGDSALAFRVIGAPGSRFRMPIRWIGAREQGLHVPDGARKGASSLGEDKAQWPRAKPR